MPAAPRRSACRSEPRRPLPVTPALLPACKPAHRILVCALSPLLTLPLPPVLPPPPSRYLRIMKSDKLEGVAGVATPTWQEKIATSAPRAESDNSTFIDQK